MRVIYLANSRIPTHKAHGLEVFKLCEALQKYNNVILILPKRFNNIKKDSFNYYKIKRKFSIVKITVFDTIIFSFLGKLGFWIEAISFSFFVFLYVLFKTDDNDIFISHDNAPLLAASLLRKNIFYDVHDFPVKGLGFYRILMRNCLGIITTNDLKKNELIKYFFVDPEKILVYPNGVEISDFDLALDKSQAREKLGIPKEKKIILYAGSFIYWKGVETLVRSASFLGGMELIYLIGGNARELENLGLNKDEIKKVFIIENRPHEEISLWLRSADVLVLPSTSKYDISKYYTSPMKLFEYMASGTPIVASDVPSIKTIVNNELVSFFMADDAKDLAQIVQFVLKNYQSALLKAKNAQEEVKKYTWDQRALHIKNFYEKRSN